MRTQSTIIREFANGFADGFLNDLAAGHVKLSNSENALFDAFTAYVGACGEGKQPSKAANKKRR